MLISHKMSTENKNILTTKLSIHSMFVKLIVICVCFAFIVIACRPKTIMKINRQLFASYLFR